jgi:hypothetical protein
MAEVWLRKEERANTPATFDIIRNPICIASAPPIEKPPVYNTLQLMTLSGVSAEHLLHLGHLTNYDATLRDASVDYFLLNEVGDILSYDLECFCVFGHTGGDGDAIKPDMAQLEKQSHKQNLSDRCTLRPAVKLILATSFSMVHMRFFEGEHSVGYHNFVMTLFLVYTTNCTLLILHCYSNISSAACFI